ncbi:hypothetical protein GUJ93_ZPchr0013g34709 [Zizania palustris]|uniref:Uncharacterized protein n=1 Tax=Zizania palustris TaxID=103762 RepID=A0A8J5X482_ZIZPA|nr:hypothetical protein GUJ93_ZPchr0013g34709 [Zizania palustris]
MTDTIEEGGVAEIYVEAPEPEADVTHESPSQVTALNQSSEERDRNIQFVRAWYSPSKVVKQNAVVEASSQASVAQPVVVQQAEELPHEDTSDNDSEYLPGDEASSGEDEEATEILKKFKQFKTKLKAGEAANLDDVVLDRPKEVTWMYEIEDDGNATSYEDNGEKNKGSKAIIESNAKARVHTTSTGKVELNLKAFVPMSRTNSSVTVSMTSSKAQAQAHAQENPRKKLQVR